MIVRIFTSLVVLTLLTASCNVTFEIGLERISTEPVEATATAPTLTDTPSPTTTQVPPTRTEVPTASPTTAPSATPAPPTHTSTPTSMPGKIVVPLSSLGRNIPWLPLEKTRWPVVHVVTFNTLLPPFDNPLVRQAFAAAVDKDVVVEMAKKYYAVDPSPATTFIPPQTLGRNLYGEVGINYDPDRAKELLAEAGYQDTTSFPKVTFIVNSYGNTAPGARFNIAKAIAEMWLTHLGLTVEVKALEPGPFKDLITSNPPALFWIGWLPGEGNDPEYIINTYRSGSEWNYGHFLNLDFDSLIGRAKAAHDPATRQGLYIQAERVLCEEEAGIIPLYFTFMNLP